MRKGLTIQSLQSLCDDFKQDIIDGPFGSELQRKDYLTEGVPVLKIQNVKPFAIEIKKMDYVSAAKFQELRRHSYRNGDIVMTKLGKPLGISALVEDLDEGLIVADLVRIRAQRINTKYLCYHLNSPRTNDFINSLQKGTTRPRVTLSVVRELPIFVPSPAEQKRIVAILDEAFAGIARVVANTEKNLASARELFESHLNDVFTRKGERWVEKKLGQVCENLDSKRVPITKNKRVKGQIPYYGASGIVDYVADYIFNEELLLVSEDGANLLARTYPIAFSIEGKSWVNNHAHALRFEKKAYQKFIEHYLNSIPLEPYVSGMAQPKLNQKALNSITVPWPNNIDEAASAVEKITAIETETKHLESIYQQKLDSLAELKQSILQKAFSGELTQAPDRVLAEAGS